MSEHNSAESRNSKPSNSHLLLAVSVVVALVIVAIFVLSNRDNQQENTKFKQDVVVPEKTPMEVVNTARPEPQPQVEEAVEPAPIVEPEPIPEPEPLPQREPEQPVATPLPSLDDSDVALSEQISNYLNDTAMDLVVTEDMIRRSVVFVDNLAQGKVAKKHFPVSKPTDSFMVIEDDIIITDPNSFERYTPYVNMLNAISTAQLVRTYNKFRPLIGEAYEEIGYDGGEFDLTLQEAIGELLETPIPETSLPLLQESVTYKYAYAEWEQLSDAQKLFLRMGPENMKKMKKRLQDLKVALAK
ncbi:DUF3014 domain-containing protein [Pseudoalteromonas rubra]|uniref:DUF3014 domain-containing protein n=1 Tax=Pseudoalteromonas rubra TaxID=43658 RepID=A0A5S3WIX4_9GAMM|nr:DUF3014 domain-containing protein [Pseudoalteromonas rubra]TMP27013.1 DUF3014 domain-containing protein [Pseudoalteromonas rubra]TMP36222.1 DUF3014 domain-containing protein [Pseudoalteromonas rubra]